MAESQSQTWFVILPGRPSHQNALRPEMVMLVRGVTYFLKEACVNSSIMNLRMKNAQTRYHKFEQFLERPAHPPSGFSPSFYFSSVTPLFSPLPSAGGQVQWSPTLKLTVLVRQLMGLLKPGGVQLSAWAGNSFPIPVTDNRTRLIPFRAKEPVGSGFSMYSLGPLGGY